MATFDYSVKRLSIAVAVLFGIAWTAIPASADPIQSHGLFSLDMEMLGGYEGLDLGNDKAGAIYQYTLEIKNRDGKGFLHNANARCFSIGYFTDEPEHQTGFCTITDTEGDTILQRFYRSTVLGHVTFVSGTGKYDGLVGKAGYVVNAEDVWEGNQVASSLTMVGAYEIPQRIFEESAGN